MNYCNKTSAVNKAAEVFCCLPYWFCSSYHQSFYLYYYHKNCFSNSNNSLTVFTPCCEMHKRRMCVWNTHSVTARSENGEFSSHNGILNRSLWNAQKSVKRTKDFVKRTMDFISQKSCEMHKLWDETLILFISQKRWRCDFPDQDDMNARKIRGFQRKKDNSTYSVRLTRLIFVQIR